jgi:hypothetical protein
MDQDCSQLTAFIVHGKCERAAISKFFCLFNNQGEEEIGLQQKGKKYRFEVCH